MHHITVYRKYWKIIRATTAMLLLSTLVLAQEEGITVNQNKVGIGTTTPEHILHIVDGGSVIMVEESTSAGAGIRFKNSVSEWNTKTNASGHYLIKDLTNAKNVMIIEHNAPASSLYLAGDGNVGMGTSVPSYDLHLAGAGSEILQLESTDNLAAQVRLKTDSHIRRILGEDSGGNAKGQIEFNDSAIRFYGPTVAVNPFNVLVNGTYSGNVGIGTDAPESPLHIKRNSGTTSKHLTLENNAPVQIALHNTTHTDGWTINHSNSSKLIFDADASITDGPEATFHTNGNLDIAGDLTTNGVLTEYIGIGVATPSTKFHVQTNNSNTFKFQEGASQITPYLSVNSNAGKAVAIAAGASGAALIFDESGSFSITKDSKSDIVNGISNGGTALMTIKSDGKTGIGRTPLTHQLEVNGSASKNTAGSWLGNSDARLKKNITQLNGEKLLDDLLKIKGVQYDWRADGKDYEARPSGTNYGLIAQDIQKVFPSEQFVQEDSDGYLSAAYGTYDPIYIEVIRHLSERIEELEKENTEFKEVLKSIHEKLQDK